MQKTLTLFVYVFIFLMSTNESFAQYSWVVFEQPEGNIVHMKVNDVTDATRSIFGLNVNFDSYGNITEQNVRGLSRQFLTEYALLLNITPGQLKFEQALTRDGQWYVSFRQQYMGIPVFRANISITINQDGTVALTGSTAHPNISIEVTPSISPDEILNISLSNFVTLSGADSVEIRKEPELVVLPDENKNGYEYLLTYLVVLSSHSSQSLFSESYFIDAGTGDIIYQYSNLVNGSMYGQVDIEYWPDTHNDDVITIPYVNDVNGKIELKQGSSVIATDLTNSGGYYRFIKYYGTFTINARLESQHVKLAYEGGVPTDTHTYGPFYLGVEYHDWTYYATDGTNVYYHANWIHNYYNNPPFNFNVRSQTVHLTNDPINGHVYYGNHIWFGNQNGQQWAKSSDMIYHEYTHNVINELNGNCYIGYGPCGALTEEAISMDEGLSDYFAVSINAVDNNNSSIFGESVGLNRDLNNNRVWDPNQTWHWNGTVIGGAGWDMHEDPQIGPNIADKLIFDALALTPHAETFSEFLDNVLLADNNAYNLLHGTQINNAFNSHGIYSSCDNCHGAAARSIASSEGYDVQEPEIPARYNLTQNRPNPFNPFTSIGFDLPEASEVSIVIYDLTGREMRKWHLNLPAGSRQIVWDSKDNRGNTVPSGMYIYRFSAKSKESINQFHDTRKMVLLR